MYNKTIVPIDGSKLADKALDHAIHLAKSVSVDSCLNEIEIIILPVIPDLHATVGFESP
jgi:nucleotide-binding universal stress UspA family protein